MPYFTWCEKKNAGLIPLFLAGVILCVRATERHGRPAARPPLETNRRNFRHSHPLVRNSRRHAERKRTDSQKGSLKNTASGRHLFAHLLQEVFGCADALGFAQLAPFVFDPEPFVIARIEHDFQHFAVICVRLVATRVKIM